MWKKHKPGEYLIPDAVFVPEATRIPENVAYVPEGDPCTREEVYERKEYPFPVETRYLDWDGMEMRIVAKKLSASNSMLDLIGTFLGVMPDCFECPHDRRKRWWRFRPS
jgi:hypothetical protein